MNPQAPDPIADVEAIRTLIAAGFTVEPLGIEDTPPWERSTTNETNELPQPGTAESRH